MLSFLYSCVLETLLLQTFYTAGAAVHGERSDGCSVVLGMWWVDDAEWVVLQVRELRVDERMLLGYAVPCTWRDEDDAAVCGEE